MLKKFLPAFLFSFILMSGVAHAQTAELLSRDFWKTATVENVEKAIKEGADVNAHSDSGHTPLMLAIITNPDIKILEALIKNGADVNQDYDGITPLLIASLRNPDPKIMQVLLKNGADVNKRDENGFTLLALLSVKTSDPEIIKVLIKNGADVNEKFEDGATLLMLASRMNSEPKITEVLLDSDGININAKDTAGKTALDHAKENKGLYNTDVYKKMEKMASGPAGGDPHLEAFNDERNLHYLKHWVNDSNTTYYFKDDNTYTKEVKVRLNRDFTITEVEGTYALTGGDSGTITENGKDPMTFAFSRNKITGKLDIIITSASGESEDFYLIRRTLEGHGPFSVTVDEGDPLLHGSYIVFTTAKDVTIYNKKTDETSTGTYEITDYGNENRHPGGNDYGIKIYMDDGKEFRGFNSPVLGWHFTIFGKFNTYGESMIFKPQVRLQ